MNKELQDQAWATLPQEFKKEVREEYEDALEEYDGSHDWSYTTIDLLERMFGKYNLTEE